MRNWAKDEAVVEIEKYSEGGPVLKDLLRECREAGLKVRREPSGFVGLVGVELVRGSLRKFRRVLKVYGVDYFFGKTP